jgi:ADP-ribose pyrophosphatase
MTFIEMFKSAPFYPEYPELAERAKMDELDFLDWEFDGRPAGITVGIYNHPNYQEGLRRGRAVFDDGEQRFFERQFVPSCAGEYLRDSHGRPVHPYAREILIAGLAVEGPGAAWTYGPNLCADPIVLGVGADGYLRTVAIRRGDNGIVALPGGHIDAGETPTVTALRELAEETGVDVIRYGFTAQVVHAAIVPDPRTTLNAWPETTAVAIVLDNRVIDDLVPIGGDDAAEAFILKIDEGFYRTMNVAHAEYVRRAVEWFEERFEVLVMTDGYVDCDQD